MFHNRSASRQKVDEHSLAEKLVSLVRKPSEITSPKVRVDIETEVLENIGLPPLFPSAFLFLRHRHTWSAAILGRRRDRRHADIALNGADHGHGPDTGAFSLIGRL
jgi:hypothetical protein